MAGKSASQRVIKKTEKAKAQFTQTNSDSNKPVPDI